MGITLTAIQAMSFNRIIGKPSPSPRQGPSERVSARLRGPRYYALHRGGDWDRDGGLLVMKMVAGHLELLRIFSGFPADQLSGERLIIKKPIC